MDWKKLSVYAGTSSLAGFVSAILYHNVKGVSQDEEKVGMISQLSQNVVASLPAALILPRAIQKSFINLYSVENPAIVTYLYSACKGLPSLFGITMGRSLLIVSMAGLITKNYNKKAHVLSLLFGVLIYLYSKLTFFKSPLRGSLNVFHGDMQLSQMADAEVRIYKAMVRSFRETEIEKFLSMNEPLDALIQRLPYIFKVSTQSVLMPFKRFLERESKILKVGKQALDNISVNEIQSKLKIKSTGGLAMVDQYTDGIMKILSKSPGEGPDYRKHTEHFMSNYGNDVLKEMNNSVIEYGMPTVVCVLSGSLTFQLTGIFLEESSEWYNRRKPVMACCLDFGKRIFRDYYSIALIVVGCGAVEYYSIEK